MMRLIPIALVTVLLIPAAAQNTLWRSPADPRLLDLRHGPGADELEPNAGAKYDWVRVPKSTITARVVADDRGRSWYMKSGNRAGAEVAASRILWGIGYYSEPTFFLASISAGGKNIQNVCLRLREPSRAPKGHWDWKTNPFAGSVELDGLRAIMILLAAPNPNTRDNVIWAENPSGARIYTVWNLEQSLGRPDTFQHSAGNLDDFANTDWVREYRNNQIVFRNGFKIRAVVAKWVLERFTALTDEQIDDAFAAGGFSATQCESYRNALRERLHSLEALLDDGLGSNQAVLPKRE